MIAYPNAITISRYNEQKQDYENPMQHAEVSEEDAALVIDTFKNRITCEGFYKVEVTHNHHVHAFFTLYSDPLGFAKAHQSKTA